MENTSGMGVNAQIPAEIKGWSWGAFFLNWIWGLFNNTFIALLTLVPCVGWVMAFVLGAKGNEWAWRNKKWESVERFKQVQRYWAWGGLALLVAWILFAALILLVVFATLRQSDAYQKSWDLVQKNPQVIERLGTPLKSSWFVTGDVKTSTGTGHAEISYSISGPKGTAEVYVKARKVIDHWEFQELLVIQKYQEAIDVLESP